MIYNPCTYTHITLSELISQSPSPHKARVARTGLSCKSRCAAHQQSEGEGHGGHGVQWMSGDESKPTESDCWNLLESVEICWNLLKICWDLLELTMEDCKSWSQSPCHGLDWSSFDGYL